MALFSHSIASLFKAECASASLTFTSFSDVSPVACVDPKYLNWSTSNVFSLVHPMMVDDLGLLLLTRMLLSSELMSIPYPTNVS